MWKKINEKMVVSNFQEYAEKVTAAYKARPVLDPEAVPAYQALIASNNTLFKRMLSRIDVQFIDNYDDPGVGYENAEEMRERVLRTGVMVVDKAHSDHPIFTPEDNWKFRAVHDYIVHIGGRKPFGLKGELQAYNLHAKLVPPAARPAIFSEVVGQVSYFTTTNDFPEPQKACMLYGFDYLNVGKVDEEEYKLNFDENAEEETPSSEFEPYEDEDKEEFDILDPERERLKTLAGIK